MSSHHSSSGASNSLRPAWHRGNQSGGRGFQPPPTVASERSRSQSLVGTADSNPRRDSNFNAFAALDDDDDAIAAGGGIGSPNEADDNQQPNKPKSNSRSEALRAATNATGNRSMSTGGKLGGRSLADLAAKVPESVLNKPSSGRFSSLRDNNDSSNAPGGRPGGDNAKVIRFTREKLLSMRPQPRKDPPAELKEKLEGTPILAEQGQDPVCWDSFDAEEIWATVPRRQSTLRTAGGIIGSDPPDTGRRTSTRSSATAGRWQRGVALPPPDLQASKSKGPPGSNRERDAHSPNELWDDPKASSAATDFSSFGGMPEPSADGGGGGSGDNVFDFEKMAEMTRKFDEEEVHGMSGSQRSRTGSDVDADELANSHSFKVDPKRPLASIGTTIRSGSGDDVNVFEDFDDPAADEERSSQQPDDGSKPSQQQVDSSAAEVSSASDRASEDDAPAIRGPADEDPTASSRLMAMIGVKKPDETSLGAQSPAGIGSRSPAIGPSTPGSGGVERNVISPWGDVTGTSPKSQPGVEGVIPLNPWGSALGVPPVIPQPTTSEIPGLNIQAQLAQAEEKKRQQAIAAEEMRRRQQLQEQEEAQRRQLAARQQQQAEAERARQAALQQQQQHQAGVQSQVELVLLERISAILENSWGRSDLVSILTTLHSEDSRVIPLLGTVDALRALILRNSRRIALRHEPAFGAEMAILVLTNAQWQQQQQQQEAQARAAQEQEQRLREQQERQRQMEEEQQRQQQAAAAAAAAHAQQQQQRQQAQPPPPVSPTAPWYYSDPQNNIQGPFRGNEMRQWLEAGYFKGDLPISQQPGGPFRPLSAIFPNLAVAFLPSDNSGAEAEAVAARAKVEADERERQEAEAAAKAKAEQEAAAAAAKAEQERKAAEEAAAKAEQERQAGLEAERAREEKERVDAAAAANSSSSNANGGNESSAQLKMILGLGAQQDTSTASTSKNDSKPEQQPAAPKANNRRPKAQGKNSAGNQQRAPKEANQEASSAPAPAWGGAAKPVSRKSMSEIQKEEARASAIRAMQQEGTRSSGSGWANVAASRGGSTAWSSGMVKQTPAAVVTSATSAASAVAAAPAAVQAGARPQQQQRQANQPAASSKQPISQNATSSPPKQQKGGASAAQEFGATMSPALEKWCKDQMTKLNGTDDLTLVSFCMTLNDPTEIRQYLTAYLGSSPSVNNFASEFINRRGLGVATKQEEWESTATTKKSRKKKGGR